MDQTLINTPSLRISFTLLIIFRLYDVRFSFRKILSDATRPAADRFRKRLETDIFLSFALDLYKVDFTLWPRNLTIIGLLPYLLSLWAISMSLGWAGPSSASVIFITTSSGDS